MTTATEEGAVDDQGKVGDNNKNSKSKLKLKTCDLLTTNKTYKKP